MRLDQLTRMADFLENLQVPKSCKFDLEQWSNTDEPGCSTTACAVGWAAHMKVFDGLKMDTRRASQGRVPTYKGLKNWDAVRALFGIEGIMADHLFSVSTYPATCKTTPAEVAARIWEVLRQEYPPEALARAKWNLCLERALA